MEGLCLRFSLLCTDSAIALGVVPLSLYSTVPLCPMDKDFQFNIFLSIINSSAGSEFVMGDSYRKEERDGEDSYPNILVTLEVNGFCSAVFPRPTFP